VGPRAVLDALLKRKILNTCRESNPRTPIVQPIAQRYTDCAITVLGLDRVVKGKIPSPCRDSKLRSSSS
jgi:hypothetical protein